MKLEGSITIYLSISLTIILALICTVIESGRAIAVNARLQSAVYMAEDAVFSEYIASLFSEYGLMFLYDSQDDISSNISYYLEYNLSTPLYAVGGFNLLQADVSEVNISDCVYATDNGGEAFIKQVSEYMQYSMTESAIESCIEDLDISGLSDSATKVTDTLTKYTETFADVEKKVTEVSEKITEISDNFKNYENEISEIKKLITDNELDEYYEEINSMTSDINQMKEELESVTDKISEYYEELNNTDESRQELLNDIEENKDEYDEELYEALKAEISNVESSDLYGVGSLEKNITYYSENLEEILSIISQENVLTETELNKCQKLFQNTDFSKLEFNAIEQEESSTNILQEVKDIIDGGVLEIVADNISEKLIEDTDLPSEIFKSEKNKYDASLMEKALTGEYFINNFGNYTDNRQGEIEYETEYILCGNSSDQENLAETVEKLIGIREGLNMAYLLKDSAKKAEALSLATTMAGVTANPAIITVTKYLILGAWALMESVADVKALLSGEKVSLIKSQTEWKTSITGLTNLKKEVKKSKSNSLEKGLDYNDYLRLLLSLNSTSGNSFRAMDIIQINISKIEDADFVMSKSISKISVSADFECEHIFTSFLFVKNMIGSSVNKQTKTIDQIYSY